MRGDDDPEMRLAEERDALWVTALRARLLRMIPRARLIVPRSNGGKVSQETRNPPDDSRSVVLPFVRPPRRR